MSNSEATKQKYTNKKRVPPPIYSPESSNSLKKYINDLGHVLVFLPGHLCSGKGGYIFEQILEMEKKLGRKLSLKESFRVDHKDGIHTNNNPDNLFFRE